jgi:hypothetical protein
MVPRNAIKGGGLLPEGQHHMTFQEHKFEPQRPAPDELILQQLVTAVLLCWSEIPVKVRETILEQSKI